VKRDTHIEKGLLYHVATTRVLQLSCLSLFRQPRGLLLRPSLRVLALALPIVKHIATARGAQYNLGRIQSTRPLATLAAPVSSWPIFPFLGWMVYFCIRPSAELTSRPSHSLSCPTKPLDTPGRPIRPPCPSMPSLHCIASSGLAHYTS
jgi:hypothetical protein